MSAEPQQVDFDGACPFLTCLEVGPHQHAVCPDCGAMRFGNLFCDTCRSTWDVPDRTRAEYPHLFPAQRREVENR